VDIISIDQFHKGKPGAEPLRNNARLLDAGLPTSLDEAALLMYALSFGPLSKNDLAKALKQVGMTMPDGSVITIQKLAPCIQRLRAKGCIEARGSEPPWCPPDVRAATLDAARAKGRLLRFAEALRQAVPGELKLGSWERQWGGRRFMSLSHACRDVFVALEKDDQSELKRLAGLCSQDMQTRSLVDVLLPVCLEPFQPALLERLPPQYRDLLLFAGLNHHVMGLRLNHPLFAYARAWVLENRQNLEKSLLERCVNHLAERDILAGDLAGARAFLEVFADLDTWIIRGMLDLLSGRLPEARQAYNEALRRAGKTKTAHLEHLDSFPAVLHALLLAQSEQHEDLQQVRTWLTWLDRGSVQMLYRMAYRRLETLLALHDGREVCDADDGWQRSYYRQAPLAEAADYLMQSLCWFYGSSDKALKKHRQALISNIEDFLQECEGHEARWPAMQIARLMGKLGLRLSPEIGQPDVFFAQTAIKDLSELWAVREVWEARLGALERLLQGAEETSAQPAESTRRLGWKLSESGMMNISVAPVEQKRTKSGGWTKGREIALHRLVSFEEQGFDYLTEQDKAALAGVFRRQRGYYEMMYQLDPGAALQALVGHPNVFWEDRPHVRVEVVRGTPEVCIVPKGQNLHICVEPYPAPDPYRVAMSATSVVKESPTRVRVVVFEPIHLKMAEILGLEGVIVPQERSEEALNRLRGLSKHVAIQSDVALAATDAETVEPDSRPRLRLQRLGQGLQAEMVVVPLGGPSQRAFAPGAGGPHVVESMDGKTRQTRRRFKEETARAEQALNAIAMLERDFDEDYEYTWIVDEPGQALELLEQLQAVPPEVLMVEWPKGDPITVRSLSVQQFHLSIHSAQDWFEVEGVVQVDHDLMVKMRTLLDQMENNDNRFIALGKDQYAILTRQLRKRLETLAASGQYVGKGEALRMHPLAALGLEQWKDELGRFEADAAFEASLERLRAVESYQPAIPSTLQATLRPYQVDGFIWLARLAEWGVGACLADDMGLGKTVEALALILHRASQGPTLVAAPTSVCANWVSEAQRFAPTLRPVRFGIGDLGSRGQVLGAVGPFDLVICSYTLLQQEADALQDVKFATIVLDEAQAIKNAATKRSSAAMSLDGGFRLICTGTPIENRLAELWNLFRFINPGLLGSEERFRERFVRPIEAEHDAHASHILKSLVQPFILRRTKSQVLEDLPPRTEMMRLVELSEEERALHESLRRRALERLEGLRDAPAGQTHIHVLAELMKLRRCCCNPRLVVPDCGLPGAKLEAFAELVDELRENQHKALVFSQFVDHLTLLRAHLDERKIRYQYLDGQTPPKIRQKRIDAFQNGEGDLFLISLRAGGLGLNLTAADYVIHMDPWWNPAVEDQASDRAHRIGQTRPVTVYRLVAAETIEEKIVELHHAKRDLADSLLEGTDTAHALTADELIDLLRNR
jgi:superfamily II DNA or RNA helicase